MAVMGRANLGPNFYPKLVQISSELGMKPEDLLAVMVSESGLNPSAYEATGKATGLIQFMPSTLKGIGYKGDWKDFAGLSGENQLDYVKKVIQGNMRLNGGPFTSAGQYYVANLWPIGLKLSGVRAGDPKTPILEETPARIGTYSKKYYDVGTKIDANSESQAYRANSVFDRSKKGYISYGDLIRQTEINKQNPAYQKALSDMRMATGYQPKERSPLATKPSMLAKLEPTGFWEMLEKYVRMLGSYASNVPLKTLYKSALPNHNILIQINAPDYTGAVEFSRILCAALDEDLLSTSYPHTDGHQVEVECRIAGPAPECFAAVEQMSQAVAEVFRDATIKIGGITIKTNCLMDKTSSYQPISLDMATTNYRKFLLTFAQGK